MPQMNLARHGNFTHWVSVLWGHRKFVTSSNAVWGVESKSNGRDANYGTRRQRLKALQIPQMCSL
jgi:hypothetical protein